MIRARSHIAYLITSSCVSSVGCTNGMGVGTSSVDGACCMGVRASIVGID